MALLEKEFSVPSILVEHESGSSIERQDDLLSPPLQSSGRSVRHRCRHPSRSGRPLINRGSMDANWSDTTTTDEQSCFEQHQENSSQLNVEQEGIQEEGEEDINNSEDYYESETADDSGYHATNNSSKQVATSQVGPGIDTYPKLQQRQILSEDDEPKHASHIISLKNNVSRQKNLNKMKLLVRSHALREAASPPPDLPCPNLSTPISATSASFSPDHKHHLHEEPVIITVENGAEDSPNSDNSGRLRPHSRLSDFHQLSGDSSTSFISFSLSRESSTDAPMAGRGDGNAEDIATPLNHPYTDNTGVDLHHFIVETLHRNYKDRTTLLRIEQDMIALVRDTQRTCHRFPAMSSYHRMLVHRVAAYFGMEHNVDQSGNCVVVSKSKHTRLPQVAFKQYVREDVILPEEPSKKTNLKREVVSFEELQISGRYRASEPRSRSFECSGDRLEVDAPHCRSRNHRSLQSQMSLNNTLHPGNNESDTNITTGLPTPTLLVGPRARGSGLLETTYSSAHSGTSANGDDIQSPSWQRPRLSHGMFPTSRIPKVESFDGRDLLCNYGNSLRPAVAKSYSFGGYTAGCASAGELALMRGQSTPGNGAYPHHILNQNPGYINPRFLSKQDSSASSISISRSSPTSSGYKSQQSQSVSAAPSPTPLAHNRPGISRSHQQSTMSCNSSIESQNSNLEWVVPPNKDQQETGSTSHWESPIMSINSSSSPTSYNHNQPAVPSTTVLWAVSSLDAVPPGSMLINPQTGEPFYNPDGTPYRFDPLHPLPFVVEDLHLHNLSTVGGTSEEAQAQVQQSESNAPINEERQTTTKMDLPEMAGSSVPSTVYLPPWPPNYQQHHCTSNTPLLNQPNLYNGQLHHQHYYGDQVPGHHTPAPSSNAGAVSTPSMNGYFVGHHPPASAAQADEALKSNCVAIPIAHGQGYVWYQACVDHPVDNSTSGVDPSTTDLNVCMENLTFRPITGNLSHPSMGELNLNQHQQLDISLNSQGSTGMTTIPFRPTNAGLINVRRDSLSTTPPALPSSSCTYPTTIGMPYMGFPASNLAPYHQMVCSPIPDSTALNNLQTNGQHYVSNQSDHQYVNSQYTAVPQAIPMPASSVPHGCTLENDVRDHHLPSNVEMPLTRMVVSGRSLVSNRFPCIYGSCLGPSTGGEYAVGLRPSPTLFHRQYSLPAPPLPALYSVRPHIQQQLTLPSSSICPNTQAINHTQQQQHHHQGQMGYVARPPRTRRQTSRSHQGTELMSTGAVDQLTNPTPPSAQ